MKKETQKINLKGLWLEDYEKIMEDLGEKRFRARQLASWIYSKKATDISQMSDLSRDLRDRLNQIAYIETIKPVKSQISQKDYSEKFLFELSDKEKIESVLMWEGKRVTACISTQVGCPLGCTFCATGKMGFKRNLTTGEITDQAFALSTLPISNLVVMGMGEPLMNYENTLQALRIINNEVGAFSYCRKDNGIHRRYSQDDRPAGGRKLKSESGRFLKCPHQRKKKPAYAGQQEISSGGIAQIGQELCQEKEKAGDFRICVDEGRQRFRKRRAGVVQTGNRHSLQDQSHPLQSGSRFTLR